MIPMTLREIAEVVGGTVHDDPEQVTVTGPAAVDSRAVESGGLFVAFEGERVDGHAFAEQALAAGAIAVLCARPVGVPAVVVPEATAALASLARHVAGQLPSTTVVALTGSQGKTSTKDLLAELFAAQGPTVATYGSFNNELGFPLTVLRAGADTRFLVLEMGARGVGHLADLCAIVQPDISLVLNVGKAHLGEFGSQEMIAQAKGEIIDALTVEGTAVLNADDQRVAAMRSRAAGRVRTFGEAADADVRIVGLALDEQGRPSFDLVANGESAPVSMQLLGEHQAHNAAAAATAAVAAGMPLERVAAVLSATRPASRWRMEVHERPDGVLVLNDAYNANPDSMRAALKSLALLGRRRSARTIAVLGPMRELGESSRDEHDAVGRLAVRLDVQQLLVVGEEARPIHLGASLEGSWGEESVFADDNGEALRWLREHVGPGDVVLFKASRSAALETLAEAVLHDLSDDAENEPKEPPR